MHPTKLLWLLIALLAMACTGGSGQLASRAPRGGSGSHQTPAEAATAAGEVDSPSAGSAALDESAAPPSAAPATPSAEGRSAIAPRESERRPGLGTTWGETRSSRVSTTAFVREDADSPFEMARVFYDDAAGVRAMLRQSGFGSSNDRPFEVAGGALSVSLISASGRPLPSVAAEGRHFVAGEAGDRYLIRIQNHTDERFEVVATVDGLDVVDGRPGSLHKRGYVIPAFATLEIDGFRQSFDSVAAFRFGSVDQSYAAQKGDGRNVGVIGIAFFAEAGSARPWLVQPRSGEARRRLDADPFPNRFAEPPRGF